MKLYGLTGGISSGKSTVSRLLLEQGCAIIDCDLIVRDLQAPNSACVREIRKIWPSVVSAEGVLDRAALSAIVFADARERKKLGKIMNFPTWWAIMKRIISEWWQQPGEKIVILDAPLLFETNVFTYFILGAIVVDVSEKTQLDRLLARDGTSEADARRKLAAQMERRQRLRRADYVVSNEGTKEALAVCVAELLQRLKSREEKSFVPSRNGQIVLGLCAVIVALSFVFFGENWRT